MEHIIQSDPQQHYNLISPKFSHFFTITIMGSGSTRRTVITFSETENKQIMEYRVIRGNNYHKEANLFMKKSLNTLINGTKGVKNKHLKILIPFHLANRRLITEALTKFNIDLVGYKIQDLLLDESINSIKNGILNLKSLGDVTESLVEKFKDKLNSDHKKYCLPAYKGLSFKLYHTQQKMKFSTKRGGAWGLKILEFNEKCLPKENTFEERKKQENDPDFSEPEKIKREANTLQDNDNLLFKKRGAFNWNVYSSNKKYAPITIEDFFYEADHFFLFLKKEYPTIRYFATLLKISNRERTVFRSLATVQIVDIKEEWSPALNVWLKIFYIHDDEIRTRMSDSPGDVTQLGSIHGILNFEFKPMVNDKPINYEQKVSRVNEKIEEGKDYSNYLNFKGYKIPNNMDLSAWPNISYSDDLRNATAYIKILINKKIHRLDFLIHLDSRIRNYFVYVMIRGTVIFTIKDTIDPDKLERSHLNTFKREITENKNTKTFYYIDGKIILSLEDKKVKYIKGIAKDSSTTPKILTLDLETRDIANKKIPICMSIYDGEKATSFIFDDPNKWEEGMYKGIKSIMKRKYDYYKVYVHNFSYFDAIFIIDTLSRLGEVKPIIRDNKIIKLIFIFTIENTQENNKKNTGRKYRIIFYDSFLLLPASLKNLSMSFNIENKKTIFPFNFINQENLNFAYDSDVPGYTFFPGAYTSLFTEAEYKAYCLLYKGKTWNLKRELSFYCERDTIALYQVILKFHKEIYLLFNIDISKYPTLPSVTFAIYRSNFIPKEEIPILLSKLHFTLKQAYYGGITDIYRPYGVNIHSYDVNSLYPAAMKKYHMPVGQPKHFIGDISLLKRDPFGFLKVTVTAPIQMKIPILPTKIKTDSGWRTIFPVGSWTGWYFSEELKNASKYGYKFEIHEGFLFEKANLFSDFVDKLYNMKVSLDSSDPRYFIAKLLMNALYGRFGMDPIFRETIITSPIESEEIMLKYSNVTSVALRSGNVMLTYDKINNEDLGRLNISVGISAAIAAYSRIEMTHFLTKYRDNIYAVDTDGIKVDRKLCPSEIDSKKLGKMKYEYTFKEAVFPAPKVYGGILEKPYKSYQKEMTKVKGLKSAIKYSELKTILNKDKALIFMQEKWKRAISDSAIEIKMESYTLSLTEFKREMVYNSWGDVIDTIPLFLKEGELVERNPPVLHYLPAPAKLLCLPPPKQLLCIAAPVSYLSLKAPREENIINTLPEVFYMEPPLPSIIYLPGKIQECLTAPSILTALTPPEAVNLRKLKFLCEEPVLPEVIFIPPSLPTIIYLFDKNHGGSDPPNNRFKLIALLLVLLVSINYFCLDYSMLSSLLFNQAPVESQNVMTSQVEEVLETEIEYLSSSDLDYNNINEDNQSNLNRLSSRPSGWWKYKSVFIALGVISFSLALWYWINKSVGNSSGGSTDNSSMAIGEHSSENIPTFDDISSITYEDRGFARRIVRDSFFEDTGLSARLRDRTEDLALEALNLNTRRASREEMIQGIHDLDVSPNTAIDAIQALLREAAREVNTEIPPISNALIPYNSVTDLVVYNPDNIPIPATVDMARYEIFIQYLDHYNAIIAAYGV